MVFCSSYETGQIATLLRGERCRRNVRVQLHTLQYAAVLCSSRAYKVELVNSQRLRMKQPLIIQPNDRQTDFRDILYTKPRRKITSDLVVISELILSMRIIVGLKLRPCYVAVALKTINNASSLQ